MDTRGELYARLTAEIGEIGWDAVQHVDDSLTRLELTLSDSASRAHVVHVKLPGDYPTSAPLCR